MNLELSPKQCEYIRNATHRYNGKIGATQCGKTHIDISYVIPSRIMERKGKAGLYVILGVTKETIERNVLSPMRDMWGDKNIGEINNRNIAVLFGERVYCIGAEKANQVSKLRGPGIKYLYIDEIVDIHEEVFQLSKSRLSKEYSICDFTGNPSYPQHWAKQFIDSDSDVWCQSWTLYDNPFLAPSVVKGFEDDYRGTIYFDRYVLGLWKNAEGAIYNAFADNPRKFFTMEPDFDHIYVGVDFGGNKSAFAFVASGIKKNFSKLTALMSEKHPAKGVDPDMMYKKLDGFIKRVEGKYGAVKVIYADSAEQTLINGIRSRLKRDVINSFKHQITDRIRAALSLMAQGRFYYTEDCQTLVDALCTAVYDPKRLEDARLDDGTSDIDTIDAWEYSWELNIWAYARPEKK